MAQVDVIRSTPVSRAALWVGLLLIVVAAGLPFWAPEGSGSLNGTRK